MAALEVLRDVAADGTPPVTVALVDWADEEGARFGRSLFGSSAVGRHARSGRRARPRRRRTGSGSRTWCASTAWTSSARTRPGSRLADVRRLPRAAHRAGAGARGRGPRRRHGARHRRGRAAPADLRRTGGARRLDADREPARLVPGGRALRARAARGRAPSRRRLHRRRRALRARGRHRGARAARRCSSTSATSTRRSSPRCSPRCAPPPRRAAGAEGCSVSFEHLWRIDPIPFDPALIEAAATDACRDDRGHRSPAAERSAARCGRDGAPRPDRDDLLVLDERPQPHEGGGHAGRAPRARGARLRADGAGRPSSGGGSDA